MVNLNTTGHIFLSRSVQNNLTYSTRSKALDASNNGLSDSNNYRPIELATIASKMLESVIILKCVE